MNISNLPYDDIIRSRNASKCSLQSENPWCGQFGALQIFEIIYLSLVSTVGTLGNLLVMFSIKFGQRLSSKGNMFVVNLAIADLIVTGICFPIMIGNVMETGNILNEAACEVFGFAVIVTCSCSVCTLTFISFNRFWAVVHKSSYKRVFSRTRVKLMIVFTWLWSSVLALPTFFGWSSLIYDNQMMLCTWYDKKDTTYNLYLLGSAFFLPLSFNAFFYFKLYKKVLERGRHIRKISTNENQSTNPLSSIRSNSLGREVTLLKMLVTTLGAFVLCWGPYCFVALFVPNTIHHHVKKAFGWLGMTNSSVNFIIYGVLNPTFRAGYKDFLQRIFRCHAN